jgi:hypothetical protein
VQQAPAPVAAPTPPTGSLTTSTTSIERGQPVTLNWQVNNASTVSISGVGTGLGPQGSTTVYPGSTTKYQLMANGSTLLQEQTVEVHEPKPQAPAPVVANNTPKTPEGPDLKSLQQALNPYKDVFRQASGKSTKDCQAVFKSALQGKLKDWAGACDGAKGFEVNEQPCQVGGSPDAPTLTCAQTVIIHPKIGDPSSIPNQKTFHFTKGQDGNWQISGW